MYLVDGVDDPIDTWIPTNSLVLRINKNNLKVFVRGILIDPVRVQHSQIGAASPNTLFGGGLKRTLVLELINTLVCRLPCLLIPKSDSPHGDNLECTPR